MNNHPPSSYDVEAIPYIQRKIPHFDFWDFVERNYDRLFRFWVYRRMYTPSEISHEYADESFFEDEVCQTGYIREVVELPNGDFLIGFVDPHFFGKNEEKKYVDYYKLSEIRLAWYEGDKEEDDGIADPE